MGVKNEDFAPNAARSCLPLLARVCPSAYNAAAVILSLFLGKIQLSSKSSNLRHASANEFLHARSKFLMTARTHAHQFQLHPLTATHHPRSRTNRYIYARKILITNTLVKPSVYSANTMKSSANDLHLTILQSVQIKPWGRYQTCRLSRQRAHVCLLCS